MCVCVCVCVCAFLSVRAYIKSLIVGHVCTCGDYCVGLKCVAECDCKIYRINSPMLLLLIIFGLIINC